ncbi:MAG: response regulator [Deltaproteobacteria bacterium]|nr:response regulator [Deltaproteobacteria bacterium]
MNGMKILVVDDEKIILDSCKKVLTTVGFDVLFAASADSALKALETQTPAALLIDIKMPERDGISLMGELKKRFPLMPIVIMSGYPTHDTISESVKKGATRFLAKPFTPDELIEVIHEVIIKRENDQGNGISDDG